MGFNGKEFVSNTWTEDLKCEAVSVQVKSSVLSLFPTFKVEDKYPLVRINEALNVVEEYYKKLAAKGRDLTVCHREILDKYPGRLCLNENFKDLEDTLFSPEFR